MHQLWFLHGRKTIKQARCNWAGGAGAPKMLSFASLSQQSFSILPNIVHPCPFLIMTSLMLFNFIQKPFILVFSSNWKCLYTTEFNTVFCVGQRNRTTTSASLHLCGSLWEASLFFLVPRVWPEREHENKINNAGARLCWYFFLSRFPFSRHNKKRRC